MKNNAIPGQNAGFQQNTAPDAAPEQAHQGNNNHQQPPPGWAGTPPPWQNWHGYAYQPPPPPPPWTGMAYGTPPPPPPPWANHEQPYSQPQPQSQDSQAQNPQANADFAATLRQLSESAGLGDLGGLFAFDDKEFWKGAVVGAAVILLLTNENVRDTLMAGISKATATVMPDTNDEANSVSANTDEEESVDNIKSKDSSEES